MLKARSPPCPGARFNEVAVEGEGEVYISLTAIELADEAPSVGIVEPKIRRLGLSHEGTPTFHELVDSLDGEDTLGCEDEVKVDGGYV